MKIRHIMTVAAAAVFITTGAQAKTDSTEVRKKFSFPLKIESKKKLKEDKTLAGEFYRALEDKLFSEDENEKKTQMRRA